MKTFKIGNSIDIHPLQKGAPLYIGGILIESDVGSVSHSDGDALLHSICEAILGALQKGDLGTRYPDTDDKFKGVSSTLFLKDCSGLLKQENYEIENIDCMIVLQKPNLKDYKAKIAENIGTILDCDATKINIKAGTNEGIGSIGNSESYLCWTSLIISKEVEE